MSTYGQSCAGTLARARARSGDRIAIAAYLGRGCVFDQAVADFAAAYADRTNAITLHSSPQLTPGRRRPGDTIAAVPELATNLILIGRSPVTGRFRHRGALEVGLRAALFSELVFDDRLVSQAGSPVATDSQTMDDHVLNTLRDAVRDHPRVAWRRWYRHVAADRVVLTGQLVDSGRWTMERDRLGRRVLRDTAQDTTVALAQRIARIAELRQEPVDRDEAVLALLVAICGSIAARRPRPRELRRSLRQLLDDVGPVSDPVRRNLEPALTGCAAMVRRRTRILG